MQKRILSVLLAVCLVVCIMPMAVYAVQESTKNSAKTNFGLTSNPKFVYLNDQGAYKNIYGGAYPHFIDAGSGTYHMHGTLKINNVPDTGWQRPNNIEIKSGGKVKLLFDGTLDGSEGLVWDYSNLKDEKSDQMLGNAYSMIKIKNGDEGKNTVTDVEIHFAGKCTISAPINNAVIHSYGKNSKVTIVLHDDCDVTLIGGDFAAAVGGSYQDDGRNITVKTDGKYDTNGNRISYKANGKLTCIGGKQSAGIGSSTFGTADNITIESGNVTAKGGDGGAGIGSGVYVTNKDHPNKNKASNIRITGGTVTAIGGDDAAGIGSGHRNNAENISITGGTVEATGGTYAAAIGGGAYGTVENISVSGGKVIATSGKGGAAIGGGYEGSVNSITVSGGNVTANLIGNYNTFPIGRGYKSSTQSSDCKNNMLKVSDNTHVFFNITARSGDILKNKYYSLDSLDMGKKFGFFVDENSVLLKCVEIQFESCRDHTLNWAPVLRYQYCSTCQSVKAL